MSTDHAFNRKHFLAWAKSQRIVGPELRAAWALYKTDPEHWANAGWPAMFRASQNLLVDAMQALQAQKRKKNPKRVGTKNADMTLQRFYQVYKYTDIDGIHDGRWLSRMSDGVMRWTLTRGDANFYTKADAEREAKRIAQVFIGHRAIAVPEGKNPWEMRVKNPRPPVGTRQYINRRSERPPRGRPTKRLRARRAKNRGRKVFPNPSGAKVKYPITVFAEWPVTQGVYFEDADGAIWYSAPASQFGPSRQQGTRAEVEQKILDGQLRGKLVTPRKRNPNPFGFVLKAKRGEGKTMRYTGTKFSSDAKPKLFPTLESAHEEGVKLVLKFPILKRYKVWAEAHRARPS